MNNAKIKDGFIAEFCGKYRFLAKSNIHRIYISFRGVSHVHKQLPSRILFTLISGHSGFMQFTGAQSIVLPSNVSRIVLNCRGILVAIYLTSLQCLDIKQIPCIEYIITRCSFFSETLNNLHNSRKIKRYIRFKSKMNVNAR